MHRRWHKLVGFVGVMIGSAAWAANVYVALTGDHSDGLSWATAYTNLQTAIDAAQPYDTLCLKTGVYHIGATLNITHKPLVVLGGFRGETPEPGAQVDSPFATRISGGNAVRLLSVSGCVTGRFERLTFSNGKAGFNALGMAVYLQGTTNVFSQCVFEDQTLNAGNGGGAALDGGFAAFERCQFLNAAGGYTHASGGGGLYNKSGNLEVVDCLFAGNQTLTTGGSALRHASSGTTRLFNCLIRNNTHVSPVNGTVLVSAGTVRIENCTIADNVGVGVRRTGGSVIVTNSILWNNYGGDISGTITVADSLVGTGLTGSEPGCFSADPLFENGYYLSAPSPAVDAGSVSAASLGLGGRYAQSDGTDSGLVDLGYHFAGPFLATHLYVHPSGDDANSGTLEQPFRTVTRALEIALENARIHIAPGSYTAAAGEKFPLVLKTDGVQLLGTNAELTAIDGRNAGRQLMSIRGVGRGSIVSNLTFRNAGVGGNIPFGVGKAGLALQSTAVRVVDCVISNNYLNGGNGGGFYVDGGRPFIEACRIERNFGSAAYSGHGPGLYLSACAMEIRSSVISSNYTASSGQGAGLYVGANVEALEAFNLLVISNNAATVGNVDGIYIGAGVVQIGSSTIADNDGIGIFRAGGTVIVTNSILWNNGVDVTGTVFLAYCDSENADLTGMPGCFSSNPLFVAGFRLHETSPCVDAGGQSAQVLGLHRMSTRLDGRPDTGMVDLGFHYPTDILPRPSGTVFIVR